MDSLLLAEVYIELLGARQAALGLAVGAGASGGSEMGAARRRRVKQRSTPLESRLTAEAEAEHRAFVETLGANALWHRYLGAGIRRG
jgi:DNA polymerase-3 subunit epsilon